MQKSSDPREDVLLGPGDDCAVVQANGVAVSVDAAVENIHFRRDWLTPYQAGWRAAAGALSDLAAVAARPIGILVTLAIPDDLAGDYVAEVMQGATAVAEQCGGAVLGGDVTRSPDALMISVTVLGETDRPVKRSTASVDDEVWVTGHLGGAALCVRELINGRVPPDEVLPAFATPTPRIDEALWLNQTVGIQAMLDVSDGIAGDISHITTASQVGVILDLDAIPVDPAIPKVDDNDDDARTLALSGGEDYEICFTIKPGMLENHKETFEQKFGLKLTRVGRIISGSGVFATTGGNDPEPLDARGFQHFGDPT